MTRVSAARDLEPVDIWGGGGSRRGCAVGTSKRADRLTERGLARAISPLRDRLTIPGGENLGPVDTVWRRAG